MFSGPRTPVLKVNLLGGCQLLIGGRVLASLPRRAQALLAYLAMRDGAPVSREAMSDLLWTDRGAEQARHSLRQMLLVVRKTLHDQGADVLLTDGGTIGFRPDAVQCDAVAMRRLAASGHRDELAEAAGLYQGPLLDRFPGVSADFDTWVTEARRDVTETALSVMARLADACAAAGDTAAAVQVTERMGAVDRLREDLHRRLMLAYAADGRPLDAIKQYHACVAEAGSGCDALGGDRGTDPADQDPGANGNARDHWGDDRISPAIGWSALDSRAALPCDRT